MISFLIAWLGVMVPLVISPGPANIVFAASGAKFGIQRSVKLLAGIDLTFVVQSLLVGFGFGTIIAEFPMLLNGIQIVGSVYILFLSYRFFTADSQNEAKYAKQLGFRDGVILQFFNAKGWLLVVLMFSLFTRPAEILVSDSSVFMLCALLFILNVVCHFIWIAFGDLLEKFLKTGKNEKCQNFIFGFMLACVAMGLLIGLALE